MPSRKRRTWRSVLRECRLGKWADLASGEHRGREPRCVVCEMDSGSDCGCPIFEMTGQSNCIGTPYAHWVNLKDRYSYNDPRTVEMAKAMQAFLRAVELATPMNALVPEGEDEDD